MSLLWNPRMTASHAYLATGAQPLDLEECRRQRDARRATGAPTAPLPQSCSSLRLNVDTSGATQSVAKQSTSSAQRASIVLMLLLSRR